MESNWTQVYSTNVPYKAELLIGVLKENEIEAVAVNKQDSAYLFGEIEIYVKADDVLSAKHFITTLKEF